jgi:pyruvate/2-oxoglutarate dehydrogenase complex dihydrolipoamide dehydrogenase (E3) component
VLAISPQQQKVLVNDMDSGKERWEEYDQLLIATGAGPIRPPLDGIDSSNIYDVNSLTSGSPAETGP